MNSSAAASATNTTIIVLNSSPEALSRNGAIVFDDRNSIGGAGGTSTTSPTPSYNDYHARLVARLKKEHEERRAREREAEERLLNESNATRNANATNGSDNDVDAPLIAGVRTLRLANPPLKVDGAYFYPTENGKNHRTTKYQLVERGTPILRRGQSFFFAIKTPERAFVEENDTIRLAFNFGPNPSAMKGTQHLLKLSKGSFPEETKSSAWVGRIVGHDKSAISVEVRTTPDSCVGIWSCLVETFTKSGQKLLYKCPDDIYLIFNPWERDDLTYMSDVDLLNEYVLEDQGKIWVGPHGSSRGRHWIFGQFDDSVIPLVMILLDKSGLAYPSRGNPTLVSRALSKMINSNDDNGVVVGRWDGKYKDGQAPSAWTGSVPILEEYFQTMKPVKYGQCWVFSGVLCTVCRAIGIPCRVVSNLVSAHDANSTLTIDTYYNESNEEIDIDPHNPNGGKDSIWNFHVWNDAWMARPDLPKGYGGWQVIDSTPQERSDGVFQCGPASVEAVRKGQVGFAYDVAFVVAEVNADYVKWRVDNSSDFGYSRIRSDKYHIGRMILTKQPNYYDPVGDNDRKDVIDEYKGKEGTRAERLALYNAVRGSSRAPMFFEIPTETAQDVKFDLIDLDRVPVGDPFSIVLTIHNTSKQVRTINADLSAESVYYTGVRAKIVKKATTKFDMKPNAKEQLSLTVTPEDYTDKLVEYGIMKIFAICYVDQTKQSWAEEDDFQVIKPILSIDVPPVLKVGKQGTVTFRFTNPLKKALTQCKINYEGPALTRFGVLEMKDVPALGVFTYTHSFIPRTIGTQRWVATFTSKQLIDVVGSATVDITN